jgi:hypothetical protein
VELSKRGSKALALDVSGVTVDRAGRCILAGPYEERRLMNKVVLQAVKKCVLALALTAFCLAAMAAITADEKMPDLSGTWKLDMAKSDFGPMGGPDSQTDVIDHKDPKLKIKSSIKGGPQGDRETERNYTTDGAECTNKMGPLEMKSTAKWEGKKLVIHSKGEMQGNEFSVDATYELSEDAKVLTVSSAIKSAMGDITLKSVFNKSE